MNIFEMALSRIAKKYNCSEEDAFYDHFSEFLDTAIEIRKWIDKNPKSYQKIMGDGYEKPARISMVDALNFFKPKVKEEVSNENTE